MIRSVFFGSISALIMILYSGRDKKDVLDLIKSYNNDKAIDQASNIKTDIKDISKD